MRRIGMLWVMMAALLSAIEVGQVPPHVVLEGKKGGKIDGTPWDSHMLRGKVYVVFYVDPDKKELNQPFIDVLNKRHFPSETYGSVAIVNMAATWKPNAIIEMLLEKKQRKYPRTVYVKDKQKVLVHAWKVADDTSDVLIFDKDGKLLYKHYGKMNDKEIKKAMQTIESHL